VGNWPPGCLASLSCLVMRQLPPSGGSCPQQPADAGDPRPVNDMWIAACCLAYEAPLATLNLKDYEDFTEHHGLRILGTE
jgi:predicted nucleic acid-binding protein